MEFEILGYHSRRLKEMNCEDASIYALNCWFIRTVQHPIYWLG